MRWIKLTTAGNFQEVFVNLDLVMHIEPNPQTGGCILQQGPGMTLAVEESANDLWGELIRQPS